MSNATRKDAASINRILSEAERTTFIEFQGPVNSKSSSTYKTDCVDIGKPLPIKSAATSSKATAVKAGSKPTTGKKPAPASKPATGKKPATKPTTTKKPATKTTPAKKPAKNATHPKKPAAKKATKPTPKTSAAKE
jgi:hypothetical protein